MRVTQSIKVTLAVMVLMAFAFPAYADLYWETVQVTGGMPSNLPQNVPESVRKQIMSQFQGEEKTVKNYLTPYASRTDTEENVTIIRFDNMTLYQLNPSTRTYTEIDMSKMGAMGQETAEDITITATDETSVINGYKCRKYIVSVMGMESEQWLSKDVPGYDEYEKLSQKWARAASKFKKPGISRELSGKGFPVKTVSGVMGVTSTTTLKNIKETSIDKKRFEIPGNYTKKPFSMPMK